MIHQSVIVVRYELHALSMPHKDETTRASPCRNERAMKRAVRQTWDVAADAAHTPETPSKHILWGLALSGRLSSKVHTVYAMWRLLPCLNDCQCYSFFVDDQVSRTCIIVARIFGVFHTTYPSRAYAAHIWSLL